MANDNHHLDDTVTKVCCIIGLVLSWLVTVVSLGVGGWLLGHLESLEISFPASTMYKELIPLAFNFIVTFLNEAMGYIHTCTLRWSLHGEGQLQFSSNPRLLTFPRNSWSNGWLANMTYMAGIVLTYASTSMVFLSLNSDLYRTLYDTDGRSDPDLVGDNTIHVNPFAVLAFGTGLGLQATIATFALLSTKILTWSSHPFDIAKTCLDEVRPRFVRQSGRCMMSVHMHKEKARPHEPSQTQQAMIRVRPAVRLIFGFLVALPLCSFIWGVVVYCLIYYSKNYQGMGVLGRSWSFLPDLAGEIYGTQNATDTATNSTMSRTCHATSCTTGTSILNVRWTVREYGSPLNFATVFVVAGFQIVLTLSLHCAELLVNLSRDEDVARRLISTKGSDSHRNSIIAAVTSWKTVTLFSFKAFIHWMFGLALNVSWRIGICMYPPQIFYLSAGCVVTAAFGTWLVYHKSEGSLPSTFGHIQTIVDLIDDWTDTKAMFWGRKDITNDRPGYIGVGFAGTSPNILKKPISGVMYGGPDPPERDRQSANNSQQEFYSARQHTHHDPRRSNQYININIQAPAPPAYPGDVDGYYTPGPSPLPSPGLLGSQSRPAWGRRSNSSIGSDGSNVPLTSTRY